MACMVRARYVQGTCKVRAWCVQGVCMVCVVCMMVCMACMLCMVRACAGGLREGALEECEVMLQREVLDRLDSDDEDGDRVDDVREAVTLCERTELLVVR